MLTAAQILVIHDPEGQLLIGPRGSFVGGERIGFLEGRSEIESALKRAADQPAEIDDLRNACFRWHIDDGQFQCLTDSALIREVSRACARGQLGAIFVPDTQTDQHSGRTLSEHRATKAVLGASSGVPAETWDRFLVVFDRMTDKDIVGEELSKQIEGYVEGKVLDGLLAVLTSKKFLLSRNGAKLLARVIGRSFFAVATLLWTAYDQGADIVNAIDDIVDASRITMEAKTPAELDQAARLMAAGLAALGAQLIQMIVGKLAPQVKPVKHGKPTNAQSKPAPPPAPNRPSSSRSTGGASTNQPTSSGVGSAKSSSTEAPPKKSRQELNEKFGRTGDLNRDINRRGNAETATKFYEKAGMPKEKIPDHVRGIDLDKDVRVETIHGNKTLHQFQVPGNPQGTYYTPNAGTQPTNLGINPNGLDAAGNVVPKQSTPYVPSGPVQVLRSTAAPVTDTWSVKGQSYSTQGGATQFYIPPNSGIVPKGP